MAKSKIQADILFITVNNHETAELQKELTKLSTSPKTFQGSIHREPYDDYGIINGQRVIHVTSMMGSGQAGGSRETTKKALEDLNPQLLIAVGICWGAWEDKDQAIGDVIISQQVQMGHSVKIANHEVVPRGARSETDATVVKLFQAAQRNHAPDLRTHTGLIVSLDTLFDNEDLRNKFRTSLSGLKGGEMEAMGIYEAIRDSQIKPDWLVIKGICDWGYKKNSTPDQKEVDQAKAAKAAANLCAVTLQNFQLVNTSPTEQASSAAEPNTPHSANIKPPTITYALSDLEPVQYLFELSRIDLNIEVKRGVITPNAGSLVYWPVRVRQPNIVHAVQTFVAAGLQSRGYDVRLCFDDLGTPDGFDSMSQGIQSITASVRKWAICVTDEATANAIIEKSRRFTEFVGNRDDKKPQDGALANLGDNLVAWLMSSDKLSKVLKESKLLDSETAANLNGKPRKLLSPAVVWTVLQLIAKESGNSQTALTLGGQDEKPIWDAFPQINTLSLTKILIPKVDGDMDSDGLRPASRQEIKTNLNRSDSVRDWFIRYGWHLPEVISGKSHIRTLDEKMGDATDGSAQKILDYFL